MNPQLHRLDLPGLMLARGFWLYVWEVTEVGGNKWVYVGRTGDSSSAHAQSPFARLSQHLGRNKRTNALRRHLQANGIDADTCRHFRLTAYGPILPEESTLDSHRKSRDIVAGLEKALCDAIKEGGYNVLNEVQCKKSADSELLTSILSAFAKSFPELHRRRSLACTETREP